MWFESIRNKQLIVETVYYEHKWNAFQKWNNTEEHT